MIVPTINLIPLRAAVSSDSPTTLDVLVKIIPPAPEVELKRPTLNIGLVIDRSGSMQGKKIEYARQAACYAVDQLLATDRVSVTIYDDLVETLVPSTPATDKISITRQIERIHARNSTDLHAGWVQGGVQVSQHLNPEHLNRVILLSDGLANQGQTNPKAIASDVQGLARRGVSTTTMGVGDDYNEDLLEAMAGSGDGNYYYIESPEQLPNIFQMELQGLMATIGRRVTLGIEPQGGVEVADVLNDLEVTRKGRFRLPNLVIGNPFVVVVRLKVPAIAQATDLCYFRLAWDDPEQQERQKIRVPLQLPVVAGADLEKFPFNPEVQQQVALMMSGRAKKEAVQKVDRGEYEVASQLLKDTREQVLKAPNSLLIEQEAQSLIDLDADLQARRLQQYRKRSSYESHVSQRSFTQAFHGDYYTQRYQRAVGSRIEVIFGDITTQQVDAIVNASNNALSGSVGVDAAIHRVAGPGLLEACRQLNGCSTGEAKITNGYNLPARWVIHTASPVWQGGSYGEEQMLAQCYRSCLTLATQHPIKTIAFPSISTGACGFPMELASRIAVKEVVNFLYRNPSIVKAIFVCFEQRVYDCFLAAVGNH